MAVIKSFTGKSLASIECASSMGKIRDENAREARGRTSERASERGKSSFNINCTHTVASSPALGPSPFFYPSIFIIVFSSRAAAAAALIPVIRAEPSLVFAINYIF